MGVLHPSASPCVSISKATPPSIFALLDNFLLNFYFIFFHFDFIPSPFSEFHPAWKMGGRTYFEFFFNLISSFLIINKRANKRLSQDVSLGQYGAPVVKLKRHSVAADRGRETRRRSDNRSLERPMGVGVSVVRAHGRHWHAQKWLQRKKSNNESADSHQLDYYKISTR